MTERLFADETDLGLGKRLEWRWPGRVVYPGHADLPQVPLGCPDESWLEVVGNQRLVVVTRDRRIRGRPVQMAKWVDFKVRGFVLTGRKVQSTEGSLAVLERHWSNMRRLIYERPDGPWMCSVTTKGIRNLPAMTLTCRVPDSSDGLLGRLAETRRSSCREVTHGVTLLNSFDPGDLPYGDGVACGRIPCDSAGHIGDLPRRFAQPVSKLRIGIALHRLVAGEFT